MILKQGVLYLSLYCTSVVQNATFFVLILVRPWIRKMCIDIGGMRKPYNDEQHCFDFKDLTAREPFAQFKAWFDEASSNSQIGELYPTWMFSYLKGQLYYFLVP